MGEDAIGARGDGYASRYARQGRTGPEPEPGLADMDDIGVWIAERRGDLDRPCADTEHAANLVAAMI